MTRGTKAARKLAALFLSAVMLLGLMPVAFADEVDEESQGYEQGPDFEDMGEASWASRFVVGAQMSGVIKGYKEGGRFKFKPNQPVKRQEAVAMVVRALELDTSATVNGSVYGSVYGDPGVSLPGSPLPFDDAGRIQPWARASVEAAVNAGLLDAGETRFLPMKPASREWVVQILIKGMGLDAEARQRMSEQLTFRDAPAISASAVGYVAVAVDLGLINGFEDNTFRPHKPVTRAQMAKLVELLREDREEAQAPQDPAAMLRQHFIRGVIVATGTDTVTVQTVNRDEYTLDLAAGAFIFIDNRPATLADLEAGTYVRMFLNGDRQVVFVDGRSVLEADRPGQERRHPRERTIEGEVVAVDAQSLNLTVRDSGGTEHVLQVAASAQVKIRGYGYATISDLMSGEWVKIKIRGQLAVKVEVKNGDGRDGPDRPGRGRGPKNKNN